MKSPAATLYYLLAVIALSVESCPRGLQFTLKTHRDKCYQFIPIKKTWYFAKMFCRDNGGSLLSIHDSREMDFLKATLEGELKWTHSGVWIGINDMDNEGRWQWTDETALNYTNWAPAQPASFWPFNKNEDCGCMEHVWKWRWHDYPCTNDGYLNKWICQYNTGAAYAAKRRLDVPTPPSKMEYIWHRGTDHPATTPEKEDASPSENSANTPEPTHPPVQQQPNILLHTPQQRFPFGIVIAISLVTSVLTSMVTLLIGFTFVKRMLTRKPSKKSVALLDVTGDRSYEDSVKYDNLKDTVKDPASRNLPTKWDLKYTQ